MRFEDYQAVPSELLYEHREGAPQVEVLGASVEVIALPAVIKR